jgi:MinD-like ATPase involved in chromosome partitioning or flagellar assembly
MKIVLAQTKDGMGKTILAVNLAVARSQVDRGRPVPAALV